MRDVLLVATVVAFFAVASAYVRWCDGLVRSEADPAPASPEPDPTPDTTTSLDGPAVTA